MPNGWRPTTENDLDVAATGGLLDETHHLEIKRELPAGRAANRELARDLASFAIDGGLFIIGVDEKTNPPSLHPVPLSGLAERVEQVAHTVVREPLRSLEFTPIEAPGAPTGFGYLVVTIAPSPVAPHMVDGKYYGRGDKTKYELPNEEIVRLIERRMRWAFDVGAELDRQIERDPFLLRSAENPLFAATGNGNAHLFIVAEPVSAGDELALPLFTDWPREMPPFVMQRANPPSLSRGQFHPDLASATQASKRANGWALTDNGFDRARNLRTDEANEDWGIELEIAENGGVRLFSSAASRDGLVMDGLVVGLFLHTLAIVVAVSDDAGYWGSWDFGIALSGMQGRQRIQERNRVGAGSDAPIFTEDSYRQSGRASLPEVRDAPGEVADRLLGRLLRAIGVQGVVERL